MKTDVKKDIERESERIDDLLKSVQDLQSRMTNIEVNGVVNNNGPLTNACDPLNDPDITVIASGVPFSEGELIMDKARDLIKALGDDVYSSVKISGACRLESRTENKPGLVKISFNNRAEKVNVLRRKSILRDSSTYKEVYIKSSKVERLIELNSRMLLQKLPAGHNLIVNGNGRIREKRNNNASSQQ